MAFGGFFGGIFSGIDATFIFWIIAFLICLGVTNYVFTRFFKRQKKLGTMIAVLVSIAIVYYTAKKYPAFLDNVFYGLGLDPGQILSILPWIGLGVALLVVVILGFGMLLMLVGGILIVSGLTGLAYEGTISAMIGVILFLIGFWLWRRRKKKKSGGGKKPPGEKRFPRERRPPIDKKKKQKVNLLIEIRGNGRTNPRPGRYTLRQGTRIRIKAKSPNLKYWAINGANYGKRSSIKLKMNISYQVIAVFGTSREGGDGGSRGKKPKKDQSRTKEEYPKPRQKLLPEKTLTSQEEEIKKTKEELAKWNQAGYKIGYEGAKEYYKAKNFLKRASRTGGKKAKKYIKLSRIYLYKFAGEVRQKYKSRG